ncbi:MAG: molybdopterin molybdotransferase MoeA [Coriobacteriaceae bacterium]|nr:molybdopterin molybdotransferase MoeA [Coriobacteriaceae bacterium]
MTERYTTTEMIDVEDAREAILSQVTVVPAEKVTITACVGRVLAENIVSDIDIASFDSTAMDGFAVHFSDFQDVTEDNPLKLEIVGILGAGSVYQGAIASGQALRIMTGAPVPNSTDTIVKIEDVIVEGESAEHPSGTYAVFTKMPKFNDHIRPRGEEAMKGDVLLHRGERISTAGTGLLAATGNADIAVYRRPRVAITSTGDELVDVDQIPGPGQIRNSNSYSLAAAAIDAGAEVTVLPAISDDRDALVEVLGYAANSFDFVITSGGAAEGDFDYVTSVVRELGTLFFNTVNMRPGKAQTFGIIAGTPVFGLPGNPAAAMVGFEILIRPALLKMQGLPNLRRPVMRATLTSEVRKKADARRFYLRARVDRDNEQRLIVTPEKNQSSALFNALNRGNCLLVIPEGLEPCPPGTEVDCIRLDIQEGVVL